VDGRSEVQLGRQFKTERLSQFKMKNVVIVEACRTPFDKFGGELKSVSSIDLAVQVLNKLMERAKLPKNVVENVFYGCCMHAEFAMYQNVPARQATIKAGFPQETLSLTIDRACCSSMVAAEMAFQAISSGEHDVCVACGTENMSNLSLLVPPAVRWGTKLGGVKVDDQLSPTGYTRTGFSDVAYDAGVIALEYGVSREEQDQWAVRSQKKYAEALAAGRWDSEIVTIEVPGSKKNMIVFDKDTGPRPDTNMESLGKLSTIYNSPTVTAGNAPGLNTGASAILIMSEDKAKELGVKPLAYIRSTASVADDYRYIATVPAVAIKKAIHKVNVALDELKVIEINEAFAALPLVSTKILADGNDDKLERLREITNVNGGAIALGHPVGASGARIIMTAMYELIRRGGGYAAAAICGGMAQGDCVLIEVPKETF
jgi:acetyl-CoA C-acetyltransferase